MLTPKEHFHGSDLEKIEEIYHIRKEEIINFGANVNPLGLSNRLRTELAHHLDVITGYPDRDYTALRNTIADYCHCRMSHIVVGNGSTELISLIIRICCPQKAVIVSPAYSEYEREVLLNQGEVAYFPLREENDFILDETSLFEELDDTVNLLILCNPNNPTSGALHHDKLRNILEFCSRKDIRVMIDETYVEFAPSYANTTAIPLTKEYANVIVMRGISKFFAAPGLRLGYAITSDLKLIDRINTAKNPWSINALAEVAAKLMFTDEEYIHSTIRLIDEERKKAVERLSALQQIKVYEPQANFILLKFTDESHTAAELFDYCIRQKLMIRDCSDFHYLDERFFRFCFMLPEDNERLLQCIESYVAQ